MWRLLTLAAGQGAAPLQRLGATATWHVVLWDGRLACDAAGATCGAERCCERGACLAAGLLSWVAELLVPSQKAYSHKVMV